MRNFDQWYADLISDQLWYELLRAYKDETIRKASEKVYAQLVADKTVDLRPVSENRKHVYNIVCKQPGDKPKGKSWSEIALEKQVQKSEDEEWKPVSEEERDEWLKKWKLEIDNLQTVNAVPRIGYKQSIEEGGWLPPKQAPYPCTTTEEAYIRDRHFEYVRRYYEPRTGEKLPDWIPEEEFNKLYDEGLI
jgi:hypothetical protein